MSSKLKLGITMLAFIAAGCAGNPTASAGAGATQAPVVDATPVHARTGGTVNSAHSSTPVTGRDWNCPRCYK